jgi:uncharacterized protein involved in exopolysaccharide biosynthesis
MEGNRNELMVVDNRTPAEALRLADYAAVGIRWRNRMIAVFLVTVVGTLLAAPSFREYESEMKILLKSERVDVSPSEKTGLDDRRDSVEEDLNTEVELLRSDDVLHNIARAVRLMDTTSEPLWYRLLRMDTASSEEIRTAKAVRQLGARLEITVGKKSEMITVRYRSGDPWLATRVLTALSQFYVQKHMAVRRPPDQLRFFAEQAEQYREKLVDAQGHLASFPKTAGTAAGQMELELTESRLGGLRLDYQQTQAGIQEIQKRIANLQAQLAVASPRMTTTVRVAENQYLMMQLKTTLLNFELKRTELLKKFDPSYREVLELEREIAQTRIAVEAAQAAPPQDQTTDRDPTYEWMRAELAKSEVDLHSHEARASSLKTAILEHEQEARDLNGKSLRQQDLIREVKTLEENYQLYQRKREDARISDALDQNKILNVSIAEQPTVPILPKRSPWVILMGGCVLAVVLSAGAAFVSEGLDDSFRTPGEVHWYLNLPVLAVLPGRDAKQLDREPAETFSDEQAFRSV